VADRESHQKGREVKWPVDQQGTHFPGVYILVHPLSRGHKYGGLTPAVAGEKTARFYLFIYWVEGDRRGGFSNESNT
jgi:hypothetical protein